MSSNISPKIVRDGLILGLDAGNRKSYAGTGITWANLNSNGVGDGTLINTPTYNTNGYFTFAQASAHRVTVPNFITTLSEITICVWANISSATTWGGLFFARSGGEVNGLGMNDSNQLSYTWNDVSSTYLFQSGLVIPYTSWAFYGLSLNASSATLYLNNQQSTKLLGHAAGNFFGGTTVTIAADTFSDTSRHINGSISAVSVYNRALNTKEMSQNYNALRSRFGA